MRPLRFAVVGTGFWAHYQISAWKELEGIELVAVYDRTRERAENIAKKFDVPNVYDNAQDLLDNEKPDFVDIITGPDTHAHFTIMAAHKGIDVICQKPMAETIQQAKDMVDSCNEKGVKLFVHENFRWQAPIRYVKEAINSGIIGKVFKAKVSFCSAFPVYKNQPFLAGLDHFILTDVGSHTLDICRYLFGEAKSLYCLTKRVNQTIKGEDVANILMEMEDGLHCFAELSYASILEKEVFPQTLVLIEGENGSIQLSGDFELKITTRARTSTSIIKPVLFNWSDPDYAVVHSSIVDCNRDILKGIRGGQAETTGTDNFRTVQLVWAAYESAATGKVILL